MLTLLLVLPLVLAHALFAVGIQRLAQRAGTGPVWWAWVPVLNLVLPLRIAGRSLGWAFGFLLPPVNLVLWTLAWAEVFARVGLSRRWALAMPIPVLNLAVLAHLAGLRTRTAVGGVAALVLSLPVAAAAHDALASRALASATRRLGDADPSERLRAVAEVGRMPGVHAVPVLAEALGDSDARVRAEAAHWLAEYGTAAAAAHPALVRTLREDPIPTVRGAAARSAWRVTGATAHVPAEVAAPALLESARGAGTRLLPDTAVVDALVALRREGVPHLVAGLRDPDAGVRWHAAAALLQLGRTAREAVPALLVAMDDDEWPVRNAAGRALEEVADASALPDLVRALSDASSETRYHAARALARAGPGRAEISALVNALRDEDWEVRMESAWALAAARSTAREAVPALLQALNDTHPQVRASAAWSLASAGGDGVVAAALDARLRDEDHGVREAAAGALRKLKSDK